MMRNALILRLVTRLRPAATPIRRLAIGALATVCLLLGVPSPLAGHEIPKSVTILAYLKPDGPVMRVVARVPLEAMRDIQWPLRGPGYLELSKLDSFLRDGVKLWVIDNIKIYEDGAPIGGAAIRAVRVSLMSDRSFESYESARAHFVAPALPDTMDLAWQQAMIDVEINYAITSPDARFAIDPVLARLGVHTTTVLHFVPPAGDERVFTYDGDPGLVHLDPNVLQAAWHFVALGFEHILDGLDHLLFLICLVIPFRRVRPLIVIITSFTVAHSMTMVASALGFAPTALWFPPLVEVLIAVSIVYTACENLLGAKLERRWIIAFAFGLVHGFGFAFALRDSLQFAGAHLATALATFNIGVELGQIGVLLVAVPLLNWLLRRTTAERVLAIICSALVAHTAWHWMLERGAALGAYTFGVDGFNRTAAAELLRVAMLFVLGAAVVWLLRPVVRRVLAEEPHSAHSAPIP